LRAAASNSSVTIGQTASSPRSRVAAQRGNTVVIAGIQLLQRLEAVLEPSLFRADGACAAQCQIVYH
jgi:hypothetical protein